MLLIYLDVHCIRLIALFKSRLRLPLSSMSLVLIPYSLSQKSLENGSVLMLSVFVHALPFSSLVVPLPVTLNTAASI